MLLVLGTTQAWAQFSVSGTVKDAASNRVVPGATVIFTGNDVKKGAQTSADGVFRITDLKAQSYKLKVTFVGYQAFEQTFELSSGS